MASNIKSESEPSCDSGSEYSDQEFQEEDLDIIIENSRQIEGYSGEPEVGVVYLLIHKFDRTKLL